MDHLITSDIVKIESRCAVLPEIGQTMIAHTTLLTKNRAVDILRLSAQPPLIYSFVTANILWPTVEQLIKDYADHSL